MIGNILMKMEMKLQKLNKKLFVYGMAKSSLLLKTSGPKRNLELDILRLIHIYNYHKNRNEEVVCYILVFNNNIKNLIYRWLDKYDFTRDNLKILLFENNIYMQEIEEEKNRNSTFIDSSAKVSQKITEDILINTLDTIYKNFSLNDKFETTKINWDYFKVYNI